MGEVILPFADFWNADYLLGSIDWWYYIFTSIIVYKLNSSTRKIFLFVISILSAIAIISHTIFPNVFAKIPTNISFVVYIYIGWMLYQRKYFNVMILTFISLEILAIITPSTKNFNSTKYSLVGLIIFIIFYLFRNKLKPTKLTTMLGNLPYRLYLSHLTLHSALIRFFKYHIISFFVLLFICHLLHKFIEKPCINYGKRFVK